MAFFGDAQRFEPDMYNTQTTVNLGPGSYYSANIEDNRCGWSPSQICRREPMSPGYNPNSTDRSKFLSKPSINTMTIHSVLQSRTPGPGQYESFQRPLSAPTSGRPQSSFFKDKTARTPIKAPSERKEFVHHKSDLSVGPGQYEVRDTFKLKSFNVRAQHGNRKKSIESSGGSKITFNNSKKATPVSASSRGNNSSRNK